MKKVLLSIGLLFAAYCSQAHGLERVIVEKYYVSTEADSIASADNGGGVLPVGSVTYRVFLDLKPDYSFQSIFAVKTALTDNPLKIKTTTAFYNNETRGAITPNLIPKAELKKQTIMLDSWFSAGAASKDYFGVLKSEDTTSVEITNINGALQNDDIRFGVSVKTRDGLMVSPGLAFATLGYMGVSDEQLAIFGDTNPEQRTGQEFFVEDAAIYTTVVAKGPTSENKILIGQFTTDGVFSFELNVQIRNEKMKECFAKVNQLVARNPIFLADSSVVQYLVPSLIYPMEGMPNVTVALPKGNSYKTGDAVTINATTTGNNIASVEFFVDNVSLGAADTQAPYTTNYSATTGKHTIVAKVTNDVGEEFSAPVVITATVINEVEGIELEKTVVSPNPASDELTIEIDKLAIGSTYELRDLLGTVLLRGTLTEKKQLLSVAHLPEGCYMLVVQGAQGVTCQKIVKR